MRPIMPGVSVLDQKSSPRRVQVDKEVADFHDVGASTARSSNSCFAARL